MASHLFFLVLLIIILPDSPCGLTEAQEKIPTPRISASPEHNSISGSIVIVCQTNFQNPSAVNITCILYIGDSSEILARTWTIREVCHFTLDASNLKKSREVSCDYNVNTKPPSHSPRSTKYSIVGKLPKAEFKSHPEVISIEQSVNLTCRRPDSSPAAQCTFIINEREQLSGSDCERSVTGAELLSGRHSALNEITMTCSYSVEGGGKPSLPSDPSTVTVLDLRKPNISVSTDHRGTHIHCEAPPGITGAYFLLYNKLKKDPIKGIEAKEGERGAIFTLPRSSDSTLTYCCSYQFKSIDSKWSDCVRGKNKDQSEETEDQNKLPKPEMDLYPAIIPIKELVELRCMRPDSSPAAQCTFTINEKEQLSGSDCERSVTGAELLSGRHSALNEVTMRCSYSLGGGGKQSLYSNPSSVTVLDLKKPDISVSIEHSETHIHCKAPPGITGAVFFLFPKWSKVHTNTIQAGKEERGVIFTVPRSADSPLTYCCQYQFQRINSELSDCVEAKNKDQSAAMTNPNWSKTLVIVVILIVVAVLLGTIGACLYWTHKKRKSNTLPTTPKNDAMYSTVDMTQRAESSNASSPPEVTYTTVTRLASPTSAFQPQQDCVVYSSLKTN